MPLSALLAIIFLPVGLFLLVLGMSGRRVGDHPYCRKCRFDLHAHWPGLKRCPECGVTLTAKGVRQGQRRRRNGVVAAGCFCVALGGLLGWEAVEPHLQRIEWIRYRPVSMLRQQAKSPEFALQHEALQELLRRQGEGGLSQAQQSDLIEDALAVQADHSSSMHPDWVRLFFNAAAENLVTRQQWQRYWLNAFQVTFGGNDPVVLIENQSEMRPISASLGRGMWGRGYGDYGLDPAFRVTIRTCTFSGDSYDPPYDLLRMGVSGPSEDAQGWRREVDWQLITIWTRSLLPGKYAFTLELDYEVTPDLGSLATIYSGSMTFSDEFSIVPRFAGSAMVLPDAEMAPVIAAAIDPSGLRIYTDETCTLNVKGPIRIDRLPADVAFRVTVINRSRRFAVGTFHASCLDEPTVIDFHGWVGKSIINDSRHIRHPHPLGEHFEGPVDLLLEFSPGVAEDAGNLQLVWNGELEWEGFPVN